MIFNGIALAIGLLILGAGLYYFFREKADRESRKIYGIISGIGGVMALGFVIKIFVEL